MCPKIGALFVARAVVIVIVKTGLTDPNDKRIDRELDQFSYRGYAFFRDLVGMNTDRAPDVLMRSRDGAHRIEFAEMGADRHHCADASLGRAGDHILAIVIEDVEVEVAVAVDEHITI